VKPTVGQGNKQSDNAKSNYMRQEDHRIITEKVANILAPQANLRLFISASGEHVDLIREDVISHHSYQNLKNVYKHICEARREYLQHGFSDDFQYSLGYASHYIQDLMAITTSDKALSGYSKQYHDSIEAKISGHSRYIASEGIEPVILRGYSEVTAFVRKQIGDVLAHQDRALSKTEESLELCFKTCLSVAKAICRNDGGFFQGDTVNRLVSQIEQDLNELRNLNDEMLSKCTRYINQAKDRLDLEKAIYGSEQHKPFNRFLQKIMGENKRHIKKGHTIFTNCEAIVIREIDRTAKLKETISERISSSIIHIETILFNDYGREFHKRSDEAFWYLFDPQEYKQDEEIKMLLKKFHMELFRLQDDFREKRRTIKSLLQKVVFTTKTRKHKET
jgi:hypothetical protein